MLRPIRLSGAIAACGVVVCCAVYDCMMQDRQVDADEDVTTEDVTSFINTIRKNIDDGDRAIADEDVTTLINTMLKNIDDGNRAVAEGKWSYHHLVETSDVVLIGEFDKKTELSLPRDDYPESLAGVPGLVAVESRFKVLSILRADKTLSGSPDSIRVLHFLWNEPILKLMNSPELVDFSVTVLRQKTTIEVEVETGKVARYVGGNPVEPEMPEQYLMFLVRGANGAYRPVTGQYFPDLSFRRLTSFTK